MDSNNPQFSVASDRLNPYNQSPHFPYLVTHFMDSMPIGSIGDALSDVLFNSNYAGHIWKLTVAIEHLGNIVWIGPLMPSTAPNVIIWDKYGPSRKFGPFKEFKVGNHDSAYEGRMHSHTPFIGRKVLTKWQREYNDVHGYYRTRVEHLLARLWHWKVI